MSSWQRHTQALAFLFLLSFSACERGAPRSAEKEKPSPSAAKEAASLTPTLGDLARSNPALLQPSLADEKAPATYRVKFVTTKGEFVVQVTRAWAPRGADRFYNLVKIGYYSDAAFFRVLPNFVAQFGVSAIPDVNRFWQEAYFEDDPARQSNRRGYLAFASSGPDRRSAQVFINLKDNTELDRSGFAPFGRIISGMKVADSIYSGYGEVAPHGKGPAAQVIQLRGNAYLKQRFPEMDYIVTATISE